MPNLLRFGPAFFGMRAPEPLDHSSMFGTRCARCSRAVAAPHAMQGAMIWCLYCGMEFGYVPLIEVTPGETEHWFGITRDESEALRARHFHPH